MASNYPGSLDSFDTIASDKKTSDSVGGRTHRDMHNDLGDAIEAIEAELGTDPSGGSATVKARLDAIGTVGTGSPEGVVTAAPGSTWLQTDATTDVKGWLRWIKATGTGNTGWVAGPEADTGWRNVSASLINGWASAYGLGPYIRRIGNMVTLTGYLDCTSQTAVAALDVLPVAFRPMAGGATGTWVSSGEVSSGALALWYDSQLKVLGTLPPQYLYFTMTWAVSMSATWPTSLPGSAA